MEVNIYAQCNDWACAVDDKDEVDQMMEMVDTWRQIATIRERRRSSAALLGIDNVPVLGEEVIVFREPQEWRAEVLDSDDERDDFGERMGRRASEMFQRRESRIPEALKCQEPCSAEAIIPTDGLIKSMLFDTDDWLKKSDLVKETKSSSSVPFCLKPSVGTWFQPLWYTGDARPAGERSRAVPSAAAGPEVKFQHLPSVGTWMARPSPLNLSMRRGGEPGSPSLLLQARKAGGTSPRSALSPKGRRGGSPKSAMKDRLLLPVAKKAVSEAEGEGQSPTRSPHFDDSVPLTTSPRRPRLGRSTPSSGGGSSTKNEILDKLDGLGSQRMSPRESGASSEALGPQIVGTGAFKFKVTVPEPYPGVQYRRSMNLEDRWPRYAQRGLIVRGKMSEDGDWLMLEQDVFLPMKVGTFPILTTHIDEEDFVESDERARRMTEHQADPEVPWWMVWCSVCSSSASTDAEVVVNTAPSPDGNPEAPP